MTQWLTEKWYLPVIYLILNIVSFSMYGIDKYKAVHKKWRISEAALIISAVFGIIGAFGGMFCFHHKTRKIKFRISLPLIFVAEAVIAYLIFIR